MDKSDKAYKTIGEVAKILNLKSKKKRCITHSCNKILGNSI